MTAPTMLAYVRSGLDDPSGVPSPFWTDADIYSALNAAQVELAMDVLSGPDEESRLARNLIVDESLADGATAANTVMIALCVYDSAGTKHVTLVDQQRFVAYTGMALPSFGQATIYGDQMHTNPASATFHLIYAKNPPTIDGTHDCQLDEVLHPAVVELARAQILLSKDISTSNAEAIEPDRNLLEVFRKGKQPTIGYQPRSVPYSER